MSHRRRIVTVLLILLFATGLIAVTSDAQSQKGTSADAKPIELRFIPRDFGPIPGPPPPGFETQLRIDDGSAEGVFGLTGTDARQFLWFNRFDSPGAFGLEEIWVLFPPDPAIAVGGAVELVIYSDDDSDPANGAELLGTYDVTVQAADGTTFSRYPLASPVDVPADHEVLIGAMNRYYQTGIDPPSTLPAAVDTTAGQARSWVAVWSGEPPDDPELPADALMSVLDGAFAGNWLIRGFGTPTPPEPDPAVVEVPAATDTGLLILILLLTAAATTRIHGEK